MISRNEAMGRLTNLEHAVLRRMLETRMLSEAAAQELVAERDRRLGDDPDAQVLDLLIEKNVISAARANRLLRELESKLEAATLAADSEYAGALSQLSPDQRREVDWFVSHGVFDELLAESLAVEIDRRSDPDLGPLDVLIDRGLLEPAQANRLLDRMHADAASPPVESSSESEGTDFVAKDAPFDAPPRDPEISVDDRAALEFLMNQGALSVEKASTVTAMLSTRRKSHPETELFDVLIEQKWMTPAEANRWLRELAALRDTGSATAPCKTPGAELSPQERWRLDWLHTRGVVSDAAARALAEELSRRQAIDRDFELFDLLIERKLIAPAQANQLLERMDIDEISAAEEAGEVEEAGEERNPGSASSVGPGGSRPAPTPRRSSARDAEERPRVGATAFHRKKSSPLPALIVLFLLVIGAGCAWYFLRDPGGGIPTEDQLRETYAKLQFEARARNGVGVADRLDEASQQYYEELRQLALAGDEASIRGLRLIDKFRVLMTRSLLPGNQLEQLDGRGLIERLVSAGYVKFDVALRDFDRRENFGRATLTYQGMDVPATVELLFVYQDRAWKISHVGWTEAMELVYVKEIMDSGMNGDSAVVKLVENKIGRALPPTVWRPSKLAEADGTP